MVGFTAALLTRFTELYKSAEQAADGSDDCKARLRQLLDQMIEVLTQAGLAEERQMHCKKIAPNVSTRSGARMRWQKIFEKGAKIISAGVSCKECRPNRAVAFYEDPLNKKHGAAHAKLCKSSPHYAKYEADLVEAGSVGCGHWNQFLACIHDKVPVPEKYREALCEKGNPFLDPVRLCRDQPDLAKCLEGLRFTMIHHCVAKEFPRTPHIFQRALDIEHHIGEGLVGFIILRSFPFRKWSNLVVEQTVS